MRSEDLKVEKLTALRLKVLETEHLKLHAECDATRDALYQLVKLKVMKDMGTASSLAQHKAEIFLAWENAAKVLAKYPRS